MTERVLPTKSDFVGGRESSRKRTQGAATRRPGHEFENCNHITTSRQRQEKLIKHLRVPQRLIVLRTRPLHIFSIPRWGKVRANVEMRCHSFIGKGRSPPTFVSCLLLTYPTVDCSNLLLPSPDIPQNHTLGMQVQ